jgi:hypothetical protein
LDIRLLDIGIAKQLLSVKIWKSIFFAWDNMQDEAIIREKIKVLQKAGFTKSKLRSLVQFYVYIDSDSEYDTGVYRCKILKKLFCNPFVMFNVDHKPTRRIQELRRWANKKWIFWSCDISEYNAITA